MHPARPPHRETLPAPNAHRNATAQRVADPQAVARAGAIAPQRQARWHFAEDGDADVQRAGGGIAADQFDVVHIGQGQQTAREAGQEALVDTRQRQGQGKGHGPRTTRRQVAQIDCKGLVAQAIRRDAGQEVPALHQHVAGDRPVQAWRRLQQGAIVADTQHRALRLAGEIARNQIELAQGHPFTPRLKPRPRAADWTARRRSGRSSFRRPAPGALRPCAH